jgi:hypothetical protein
VFNPDQGPDAGPDGHGRQTEDHHGDKLLVPVAKGIPAAEPGEKRHREDGTDASPDQGTGPGAGATTKTSLETKAWPERHADGVRAGEPLQPD